MEKTESALDLILKNQEGAVQNLSTQTGGDGGFSSPSPGAIRSERIRSETAEAVWKWMSQQLGQERQERQRLLEWFSGEFGRLRKADGETGSNKSSRDRRQFALCCRKENYNHQLDCASCSSDLLLCRPDRL